MTTFKQAEKLLQSVSRSEANKKCYDNAMFLIESVKSGAKNESILKNIKSYIDDCIKLDNLAIEISELKSYDKDDKSHKIAETIKKSRAADMAKSRAKADFLRDVRLTPKANENLNKLCKELELNKTQVINKLLEKNNWLFFNQKMDFKAT